MRYATRTQTSATTAGQRRLRLGGRAGNSRRDAASDRSACSPPWRDTSAGARRASLRWRGEHGAAAAVAEAYRQHGSDCLKEMSGPFADRGRRHAERERPARDRPARDADDVLCQSVRAARLRIQCGERRCASVRRTRDLSRQAIFNYLYCHVIPSPGTIYRSVQKLQPGECVTFRGGNVERRFYWHLPYHDDGTDSVEALERRFRLLLKKAARNAIDGQAAVGTFLSGGTDSSTVDALLTELTRQPARTYSIGFAWEDSTK